MSLICGSKTKKWKPRLNLHGTILDEKSIGSNQKTRLKRGAHGLKKLDAS
jgi:hypothetical protein